jgi:hypothetical protein
MVFMGRILRLSAGYAASAAMLQMAWPDAPQNDEGQNFGICGSAESNLACSSEYSIIAEVSDESIGQSGQGRV